MGWTVEYAPGAVKDLNKLSRSLRAEVFGYMQERIALAHDPRQFGKSLRHAKYRLWRYRVRDFRVICELKDSTLVVLVVGVGHRRDVYDRL